MVGFSWNLHSVSMSPIASTLLIKKKKKKNQKKKKKKKNRTISMGKVAIYSWKFAFLVYAIKSTFLDGFSRNLHSLSILSIASTLLILGGGKKWSISTGKVAILSWKICISCLRDTVCICGQIFMKLAQVVYIINSLNPIDFEKKKKKISKGKVAILSSKFAFLVYAIQSAFVVRFSWNLHSLSIINSLNPIDFEKKSDDQ